MTKLLSRVTALTIAATMFASSAYAFDPADLQKLKDTGNCEKCDLSNADLVSADLSIAFLKNANLRDANLRYANLSGANLMNAFLKNADLTNADLSGANLYDAILTRTTMKGAILCNTTISDGSVIYSGC